MITTLFQVSINIHTFISLITYLILTLETSRENKILSDLFPDAYKANLESQIIVLHEQEKTLEKSNLMLKKKVIRLTNEMDSKEFTNERLVKLVEKLQKPKAIDAKVRISKILATASPSNIQGVREFTEFWNVSSIIYDFEDLKDHQTNDYDKIHENIIENIEEEEEPVFEIRNNEINKYI
jgi:hypothetical protein